MRHFVTEMGSRVHISVTKWCILIYGTCAFVHFEICATGLFCLEVIFIMLFSFRKLVLWKLLTLVWKLSRVAWSAAIPLFVVARSRKSLATLTLGSSKIKLLTISRLWRYCGPSNYRFNFILYWYAPWVFFWGRQCAFVFPIYVRKYRK